VIECLLCKCQALSSNPNPIKNKQAKKKKKRILGDTNIQTMADLGDTNIQTMADRHHWDKWGNMNEFYRSTDGSIVPMLVS
jgi:hypothetical protein